MKSVFSFYVVSWEKNLKQWWLFRPANSILYNFRDNFQILGMGNQSSTMGYHKPPGDLTTAIIKIITITLTPGLVTPAHHRPNHHHPNYHHPSHHHPNNHQNIDSRTGDPGPPPASSGKKETKEAQWLCYWQVWSWWWPCWRGSKKSDLDKNRTI